MQQFHCTEALLVLFSTGMAESQLARRLDWDLGTCSLVPESPQHISARDCHALPIHFPGGDVNHALLSMAWSSAFAHRVLGDRVQLPQELVTLHL
jgi:hypothetical protein